MSFLSVDHDDPRPPYEQLSSQLLRLIASGDLVPGERLAPIRQLAADLGLASNTVARTYRELEQVGAIVSRGRRGTVVADQGAEIAVEQATRSVTARIDEAIDQAIGVGMSTADILRLVQHRLRQSP